MLALATRNQNIINFIINKAILAYLGVLYSNIYWQNICILQVKYENRYTIIYFTFIIYVEGSKISRYCALMIRQ